MRLRGICLQTYRTSRRVDKFPFRLGIESDGRQSKGMTKDEIIQTLKVFLEGKFPNQAVQLTESTNLLED